MAKEKNVTIPMEEEMRQWLRDRAAEEDRTIASLMRRMVMAEMRRTPEQRPATESTA